MPVDFAAVRSNAMAEGIPSSEIAVIYKNLSSEEREYLIGCGLVAYQSEGTVIARLVDEGSQPFSEKAEAVYSLAS